MNILHTNTLCDVAKKQNLLLVERKLTADLCFVFSLIWWLPITFLGSGRHLPGAISKPEHEKAPFIPSLDSARFEETKRQFDFSMIWRSGQNLNENRRYTLRRSRSCICQFRLLFLFFVFFFSMKFSSSVGYANVHFKLREIVKMIDPFFLGK